MFDWGKNECIVLPIAIAVILFLTFICYKLLKNDKEDKELPLKVIAIIILVLEIAKQIRNIITGFDSWNLPFHYCSLFVFFFPLAQFGNNKVKSFLKPVAFACSLTVTCAIYSSPTAIMGSACDDILKSFSTFHTFVFHHLVVLYCAISIALKTYIPKKSDYKPIIIVMGIYGAIAIFLSNLLDTNYCNFLSSSLDFIEEARLIVGQVPYTLFIYICISAGTVFVSYIYYLVFNAINKKSIT